MTKVIKFKLGGGMESINKTTGKPVKMVAEKVGTEIQKCDECGVSKRVPIYKYHLDKRVKPENIIKKKVKPITYHIPLY